MHSHLKPAIAAATPAVLDVLNFWLTNTFIFLEVGTQVLGLESRSTRTQTRTRSCPAKLGLGLGLDLRHAGLGLDSDSRKGGIVAPLQICSTIKTGVAPSECTSIRSLCGAYLQRVHRVWRTD